jgi:hypothetical protein
MVQKKIRKSDFWRGRDVPKAAAARSTVVLTDREASKPIGIRSDNGAFVTLYEFKAEPTLAPELESLSSLDYRKLAEFTIARLEREPENLRIGILGLGELSRNEVIQQIKDASPIGKQFVQIERDWVERLKDKLRTGEYTLRAQASASSS